MLNNLCFLPDEAVVQWEGDADGEQQVLGRIQLESGADATTKTTGHQLTLKHKCYKND